MKIANSNVAMNSGHTLVKEHYRRESVRSWRDDPSASGNGSKSLKDQIKDALADQLQISKEALEALKRKSQNAVAQLTQGESMDLGLTDEEESKIYLLEKILSILLGKEIKFRIPRKLILDEGQQPVVVLPAKNQSAPETQAGLGWGFAYDYYESYRETEQLSFETKGTVQTGDGRVINFEIQLNMSREFYRENSLSIRAGDAKLCDPLVINYEGTPAGLTDTKFSFDLDCDGKDDQISFVKPGSGFLSLDLNNDGKINDGSELFGPATGAGFAELAKYDQDQNGWIDENDPVFERLRIWTKDKEGKDVLLALGQKGVGAIYLGNVAAQFELKNRQNELKGQAQTAGVFLREDGAPGLMQQIDLVV